MYLVGGSRRQFFFRKENFSLKKSERGDLKKKCLTPNFFAPNKIKKGHFLFNINFFDYKYQSPGVGIGQSMIKNCVFRAQNFLFCFSPGISQGWWCWLSFLFRIQIHNSFFFQKLVRDTVISHQLDIDTNHIRVHQKCELFFKERSGFLKCLRLISFSQFLLNKNNFFSKSRQGGVFFLIVTDCSHSRCFNTRIG